MENIIQIRNITKEFRVPDRREGLKGSIRDLFSRSYHTVRAVDDISMDIAQGEIVGYLGPNGAGKSTTIKMMTGVLEPSAGEILVNGCIPYRNRTRNARNIGVVFGQRSQLWWALPLIGVQLAWAVVMTAAGCLFWKRSLRQITVNGG